MNGVKPTRESGNVTSMIWKPNVTVAAISEREGRFLLVEEEVDGRWVLNQPAGHLDEGEDLIRAVIRETAEETAHDFVPQGLVGIYRWRHPVTRVTYLRFAFYGPCVAHHPLQPLDDGIRQALWLPLDEIASRQKEHRSPQVALCIEDYLRGIRYPLSLLREVAS